MAVLQSQQIDLLFGVKGGGSVNGESGQKIQSQINGIVSGLKKAKIQVDYTAVIRAHKQLEQLKSQIDVINNMPLKVGGKGGAVFNIKTSGGVATEAENLYKQVQKITNGLPSAEARVAGLNRQLNQTKIVTSDLNRVKSLVGPLLNKQGTLIGFGGAKTHLDEMRNIVSAYGQYTKHIKTATTANKHHNIAVKNADANMKAMYGSLKTQMSAISRFGKNLLNMDSTIPEVQQAKTLIASLEQQIKNFKTTANTIKPINFFANNGVNSSAMRTFLSSADLQRLPAVMAAATQANKNYGKSINSLESKLRKAQTIINNFGSKRNKLFSLNKELAETKEYKRALLELQALSKSFSMRGQVVSAKNITPQQIAQLDRYLKLYDLLPVKINAATAATHKLKVKVNDGLLASKALNQVWSSFKKFPGIDRFPDLKQDYLRLIDELSTKTKMSSKEAAIYATRLKDIENRAFAAGAGMRSFTQSLNVKLLEEVRHLLVSFATTFVIQGFRILYQNVLQIDTAMTELKKVTQATSREYVEFLDGASDRAKKLGASLTEVINATADYARMGYNIEDASELADTAIVYQNVGDGLQDIDEATSHLISTMTAFGKTADDAMHIVDIFNEVANNYAVSAADIGTGLKKSAAAMSAAGNSLEETVALFTAANTIAQDAETVGTALKTMSMRLRSTKSDMEAAGEDTEGMADSVSSLRKEILALTGVDIQLDDNTYKSSYQMLKDIAEVWDKLDDLTRANVLERLFGKRQANIGSGLLENFDIADEALATALDSAGSALQENEKYLESIQGHLDQLSASFQTFSQNFLDSEFVKFVIDLLKGILDFFNGIIVSGEKAFGVIGQTTGAILSLVAALTALDALWGFQHAKAAGKTIVSSFKWIGTLTAGLKELKNILPLVTSRTISLGMGLSSINGNLTDGQAKIVTFTAKAMPKIKSFVSLLLKSKAALLGFGAAAAAIGLIFAGQLYKKKHSAGYQTEEVNKSFEEYREAATKVESCNQELQTNKKRLEELSKIPWANRTREQQDEIDRIKEENELLEAQINYYNQLKEQQADETRADIVQSINDTAGDRIIDAYSDGKAHVAFQIVQNGNVDYYTAEQAKYVKDKYDQYKKAYLDALNAGVGSEEGQYATQEAWDTAVQNSKSQLESVEKYYNGFIDNTESMYDKLIEVISPDDEAAMEKLRELAAMLQELGLWTEEHTAKSIEIFNIDELSKFEEIKEAIEAADGKIDVSALEEAFGKEAIDALKVSLDEAGISWDAFIKWCDQAQNNVPHIEGEIVIDTESIEKAIEATKNLSSSCKTLADAFKEQNENGALGVDTILDVIDAGYAAALVVDRETGAVRLNADMYRYLAQMKINDQVVSLNTQKMSLMDTKLLLEEAVAAGKAAKGYATLAETKTALAQVEAHIAGLEAQIVALNNIDVTKITQGIYGIGDAAKDAKSQLSNLQSGMETLLSQTVSWLKDEYSRAQDAQEDYYNAQIDALEEAKDAAKERWDAEKEALEDVKDSYNDIIDAQIELLKRQKDADDYAKSRAEKEKAVSDIEAQLLAIQNDDSIEAQKMRLELEEQLKEAQDELDELQSDREYKLREQALQDEKDRYNDEIDAKIEAIEKQSEAEEKAYQERIDRLQDYLNAVRDSVKTEAQWRAEAYDWIENREEELYQQLLEWNRIYGDGRDSTVEAWFKEAEGWEAWGSTFAEARDNLARYLQELESAAGGVITTTKETEETAATELLAHFANILGELLKMKDAFVAEGDILMASLIDDVYNGMQKAMNGGYEFTEEMLDAMSKAIESGDLDFLNAVKNMMGYYNEFAETGIINISEMSDYFTQALIFLNENQQAVLQGMYNNIKTVAEAARDMNKLMEDGWAHNESTGWTQTTYNNGIATGSVSQYDQGGVVDYTGPAAVHGSKSHPEVVFNADAAAKLYNYVINTPDLLKSAFDRIAVDNSKLKANPIGIAPTVGDININISGNADASTVNSFRKLAGEIRDEVVKSLNDSMSRRGITRSPRMV